MSRLLNGRVVAWLLLTLIMLAGCSRDAANDPRRQAKLIDAPMVGDHYAAELTYFSDADFEARERVFGLMKVMAVDGDDVTLVTENAGSTDRDVAIADLQGDLAEIDFDDSERILIGKDDLLAAHAAGKIFAVRR